MKRDGTVEVVTARTRLPAGTLRRRDAAAARACLLARSAARFCHSTARSADASLALVLASRRFASSSRASSRAALAAAEFLAAVCAASSPNSCSFARRTSAMSRRSVAMRSSCSRLKKKTAVAPAVKSGARTAATARTMISGRSLLTQDSEYIGYRPVLPRATTRRRQRRVP